MNDFPDGSVKRHPLISKLNALQTIWYGLLISTAMIGWSGFSLTKSSRENIQWIFKLALKQIGFLKNSLKLDKTVFEAPFLVLSQNGISWGTHLPCLPQIRLAGPCNSNPLSHVYLATVPGSTVGVLNSTVEWAGAPGNPHFSAER